MKQILRNKQTTTRIKLGVVLLVFVAANFATSIVATIEIANLQKYRLTKSEQSITGSITPELREKFQFDDQEQVYRFNPIQEVPEDKDPSQMTPADIKAIVGSQEGTSNLYSVDLPRKAEQGVRFEDTNTKLSFRMVPQFELTEGRQVDGHVVYITPYGSKVVYTVQGNGVKEDILYEQAPEDGTAIYAYKLDLPDELEARLHEDGSLGVYSANLSVFGNVETSTAEDKRRLQEARVTGVKDHLLFDIPAPIIVAESGDIGSSSAVFSLKDDVLYISSRNLHTIDGPFSIDPTVVVTSTADFASGNNEDNVDIANNEIKRGALSGGSTGAWGATGNNLTATRSQHTSIVSNGFVYAIGGLVAGTASTSVIYAPLNANGTIGTWTSTTAMPETRREHTSVVSNGFVYAIGGLVAGTASTSVIYAPLNANGTIGTWTSTTAMPEALQDHTSVASNGYVYAIGGAITTAAYYAPLNANGTIGTWTSTTAMPEALQDHTSVASNGYVYAIGGVAGSTASTSVIYAPLNANGTIGTWTETTAMPQTRRAHLSVVSNGYVYAMGGLVDNVASASVIYAPLNANGTIGTWTETTAMPQTRRNFTSVLSGGYIVNLGGLVAGAQSTSTQSATIRFAGYLTNNSVATAIPGTTCGTFVCDARYAFAATQNNNYVYVSGGGDNVGVLNAFEATNTVTYAQVQANGSLGSWNQATASLPQRLAFHRMIELNGYLYVMGGGSDGGNGSNAIYYTQPSLAGNILTWTTSTLNLPLSNVGFGATAWNNRIYLVFSNGEVYYSTQNANGSLGSWNSATNRGTTGTGRAVAINGYLYSVRGTTVEFAPINNNGSIGTWSTTLSSPFNAVPGLTVYRGVMYINGSTVSYSANINSDGTISSWQANGTKPASSSGDSVVSDTGNYYSLDTNVNESRVYYSVINNGLSGANSTWTAATSLPSTATPSVVELNGYAYSCPSSTCHYSQINRISGELGPWVPTAGASGIGSRASIVAYNGYLYIGGGITVDKVMYALPSSDGSISSWAVTTNFPQTRYSYEFVAYNNFVYAVGGIVNSSSSTSVIFAPINRNGSIGAWTSTTSTPVATSSHTSVVHAGNLYLVGGEGGSSSAVRYAKINSNGSIGAWVSTASLPFNLDDHGLAVSNGFMYVTGGFSGNNGGRSSAVYYATLSQNGAIDRWETSQNPLPDAQYEHATFIYSGRMYTLGGRDGAGQFTNVVRFTNLSSIARVARYSKIFDLGSLSKFTHVSFNGTLSGDRDAIKVRFAGNDSILGDQMSLARFIGTCTDGTIARFVHVTIELDNSETATFADLNIDSIQDFTVHFDPSVAFGVPSEQRLRGGKHFDNEQLQSLDTKKLLEDPLACTSNS